MLLQERPKAGDDPFSTAEMGCPFYIPLAISHIMKPELCLIFQALHHLLPSSLSWTCTPFTLAPTWVRISSALSQLRAHSWRVSKSSQSLTCSLIPLVSPHLPPRGCLPTPPDLPPHNTMVPTAQHCFGSGYLLSLSKSVGPVSLAHPHSWSILPAC